MCKTHDVVASADCEGHAMANEVGVCEERHVRRRVVAIGVPKDVVSLVSSTSATCVDGITWRLCRPR